MIELSTEMARVAEVHWRLTVEFCGMKRIIDRKCLNHARVHANAQSFDRCEGQRPRFLVLTKRSAASGDENAVPNCSVALSSCVADMSDTFRLIICVVVSSNENAL